MASKNYNIHHVTVTRPDEHVGKAFNHTGWSYEKGDFIKKVNTTEAHAKEMNEQAHNTHQMYYLIEDEAPAVPAEEAVAAKAEELPAEEAVAAKAEE